MALFGKKPDDKGPLDYANRWPLRLWVGAVLLFLYLFRLFQHYLPPLVVALVSLIL